MRVYESVPLLGKSTKSREQLRSTRNAEDVVNVFRHTTIVSQQIWSVPFENAKKVRET